MGKYVLIFKPQIAKKLIHMGHIVKDIAPNKNNYDLSVFYFEDNERLRKDFNDIVKKNNK